MIEPSQTVVHIALAEADFRTLVSGGMVENHAGSTVVRVILSDIGWTQMLTAVIDASDNAEQGPSDG